MKLVKIEIKSRYPGKVLFSHESENNTIKDTLLEAVRKNVDLSNADLRGADLNGADLRCANLCIAKLYGANLRDANLCNANLSGAYLYCADLGDADLRYANLRDANLCNANLSGAYLYCADISCADLRYANLRDANLSNAYLRDAYLSNANLRNANLCGAKEIPFVPFYCPSEGSFIGWKKVSNYLIKLQIPEDAKRSSATSQKCRCDKAKVLAITKLDGTNPISEIENFGYSPSVLYKVGEMVIPDSFDEDRWNECSHGIHFFINKQDAINYNL